MQTLPWCAWNTPSISLNGSCPSAYLTPLSVSLPTLTAGLPAGEASKMEVRFPSNSREVRDSRERRANVTRVQIPGLGEGGYLNSL